MRSEGNNNKLAQLLNDIGNIRSCRGKVNEAPHESAISRVIKVTLLVAELGGRIRFSSGELGSQKP